MGVYQRQAGAIDAAGGDGSPGNRAGASRAGRRSDEVTISDEAQQLRRVLDAVNELPDLREARIAQLRQQLAQGRYGVDAAAIAERLVDEGLTS
jgi:negative regulator of flagellin synthesis FlgM